MTKLASSLSHAQIPGVALIAQERVRQRIAEGYTPEHDRDHVDESLALAACSYAIPGSWRRVVPVPADGPAAGIVPTTWPWAPEFWKPSGDRVRDLVKAGALIAAEVDRLLALPQPHERVQPDGTFDCRPKDAES